jgi:hypothetical protein
MARRFIALLPLLALACAPSQESVSPGSAGSEARSAASIATAAPIDLAAPAQVPHAGLRRVEIHDELGRQTLAYRERIVSDGAGRFSLRPTESLTPVAGDWIPRQLNREGYLFRYRDFALRSVSRFSENYRVSEAEAGEPVAGRAVQRYRVERRQGEPLVFELWIDQATRLPLRVEERGPAGALRSRVEYESFETDPDLDAVIWFQKAHDERALDPHGDLSAQVGRPVPTPKLVPAGFRLWSAFTLADEAGPWVKLVYTDGVQTFFYLHRAPQAAATGGEGSTPKVLAQLPSTAGAGDLFLHRMGAAGVAQATLDAGTFIAVGKVSDDELVDAIESALP